MSYLLFVDESGHDQRDSPYEVLAGVAVRDRDLWNLITALHEAEIRAFGQRYSAFQRELKARALLKRKVWRHAALRPGIALSDRQWLAQECLSDGPAATPRHLAALAQAKIDFSQEALESCAAFRCKAFASIVPRAAPRSGQDFLRKDYAYLFERFYYFLEDQPPDELGLVVFDELERSQSHLLLDQMRRYFVETQTGRMRSGRIIPEPFFVHSDLTTGVQLADLVAYLLAWGTRVGTIVTPARSELEQLGRLVCELRHRSVRQIGGQENFVVWSFAVIDDLRPRQDRIIDELLSDAAESEDD